MSISGPGDTSFGPLSAVVPGFDPSLGIASGSGRGAEHWIGDYQGRTAARTSFHPVWNDTPTGRLKLFSAAIPIG